MSKRNRADDHFSFLRPSRPLSGGSTSTLEKMTRLIHLAGIGCNKLRWGFEAILTNVAEISSRFCDRSAVATYNDDARTAKGKDVGPVTSFRQLSSKKASVIELEVCSRSFASSATTTKSDDGDDAGQKVYSTDSDYLLLTYWRPVIGFSPSTSVPKRLQFSTNMNPLWSKLGPVLGFLRVLRFPKTVAFLKRVSDNASGSHRLHKKGKTLRKETCDV